jgi:hypothetical protein
VWLRLRFPDDGKWYSPKDVSGIKREKRTPVHIKVLEGQILERRDLEIHCPNPGAHWLIAGFGNP